MRIISKDLKNGTVKIQVESPDDLWYLSQIVDENDLVSGKTIRKIKISGDDERSSRVNKKSVFLKINAEKVEFHTYSNSLRIGGPIVEGPEDVAKGSYHTFSAEPGTILKIEKERWLKFQLDKLKESSKEKSAKILVCVLDRESAAFALMKQYGYEMLSELKGDVAKKAVDEGKKSNFYSDVAKQVSDYAERFGLDRIIIASPAFWKEYLMKELEKSPLRKKIITATCNDVGKNGIDEVLRRPEVITAIKEDRIVKEMVLVESLLSEISRNGKAAYGIDETASAAQSGAISHLILTDGFIQKSRSDKYYSRVERIMKTVDSAKGEITIVSSEHDGGHKLDGLGGIGAILRYNTSY